MGEIAKTELYNRFKIKLENKKTIDLLEKSKSMLMCVTPD